MTSACWQNVKEVGNLIIIQGFLVWVFLLTYWTEKSPDLGTTELDNLKLPPSPNGSSIVMDGSDF